MKWGKIGLVCAVVFAMGCSKGNEDYYLLGQQAMDSGNYEEAIEDFQKGLSIDAKTHPEYYVALANAYLASGDYQNYMNALQDGSAHLNDQDRYAKYIAENAKSVIWTALPKFDYKDVSQVDSTFDQGYYGYASYRQDIVAATKDGETYAIVDDSGNALTDFVYTEFECGTKMCAAFKKGDSKYMYSLDPDMSETKSEDWGKGGVIIPEPVYWKSDGTIEVTEYSSVDGSRYQTNEYTLSEYLDKFTDQYLPASQYHEFTSYNNHDQTFITDASSVVATVNHPRVYDKRNKVVSTINEDIGIYADKRCASISTTEVEANMYMGNAALEGCYYDENISYDTAQNTSYLYGYYSLSGKDITEAVYDHAGVFTDGYAAVGRDGKYGYIDADGKEAIPLIFDKVLPLYKGKGWVCYKGKWGILDVASTAEFGIPVNADTLGSASGLSAEAVKGSDTLYTNLFNKMITVPAGYNDVIRHINLYILQVKMQDAMKDAGTPSISLPSGCSFTKFIGYDDLLRILKSYWSDCPDDIEKYLTADQYPDLNAVKNPVYITVNNLVYILIYDSSAKGFYVGQCNGSSQVRRLDTCTSADGGDAQVNSFYIARGDYQNGGFYITDGGSVYVIIDKYGEIEITESEYNDLLSTSDYSKLQDLISSLISKYSVRSSDMKVTYTADGDTYTPESVEEDTVVDQDSSNQDYFSESTKTFKKYYLSYLDAINSLDGSKIQYCSDAQRNRQTERIWKFNKDYTFVNDKIEVDKDSFSYGYENNVLTAHFNVKIENDAAARDNSETGKNTPFQAVTAEYQSDTKEWIITYTELDKNKDIGSNRITIE